MNNLFQAPCTPAEHLRDELLGALVGLARSTTNEPKTEDTDDVINAGLRLAAQNSSDEDKLCRMLQIVRTEKQRVAPNCATCAMPCGNTSDYDLAHLWSAPQELQLLKLRLLRAVCSLAQQHPGEAEQFSIYQGLFALAEDWDAALLIPVVQRAEELCRG